jgi:hypothetical protein
MYLFRSQATAGYMYRSALVFHILTINSYCVLVQHSVFDFSTESTLYSVWGTNLIL